MAMGPDDFEPVLTPIEDIPLTRRAFTVKGVLHSHNRREVRDASGTISIRLLSGNSLAFSLARANGTPQGAPYALQSEIQTEARSVSCNSVRWFFETFYFIPLMFDEHVTLEIVFDPLDDGFGDGPALGSAYLHVYTGEIQEVEVMYTTFIECEVVPNPSYGPPPWFPGSPHSHWGGDNAMFPLAPAITFETPEGIGLGARSAQLVTYFPSGSHDSVLEFGASKAFDHAHVAPNNHHYCTLQLNTGAVPNAVDTQVVNDQTLSTEVFVYDPALSPATFEATFDVRAEVPLDPMAPPINGHISVEVVQQPGHVFYNIVGEHDGFPAHHVYINNQPSFYTYSHTFVGAVPWELLSPFPLTIPLQTHWRGVP